ncbi:LRR receptor-like serine threonine-protein kinase [Seminavis robusta]|uniref:LRR receptor-like serine threonine-protein kinase n=1 Tax=Seminavis robusta TaxID=568900 RepID=A0A9N8DUI8_9STRA|nr:LRR receptor-like serine threonine-protein kinase [Seminavis robusta]|eukprot:Sro367_g127740.1 LRR receptor-like serine threonine-protein kinase (787) ;mRNA; r:13718-16078
MTASGDGTKKEVKDPAVVKGDDDKSKEVEIKHAPHPCKKTEKPSEGTHSGGPVTSSNNDLDCEIPAPILLAEQFSDVPSMPAESVPIHPWIVGMGVRAASSTPGAFRSSPGLMTQRTEELSRSILQEQQQQHGREEGDQDQVYISNAEGLVEARAVDEQAVAVAFPEASTQAKSSRSQSEKPYSVLLTLAVLLMVEIILLILGLTGSFETSSSSIRPAKNTTLSTWPKEETDFLWNQLFGNLTNTSSTLQALQGPASPQSRALDWIRQDVFNQIYPQFRLRQRYALATFYYAMNGTSWTHSKNWLTAEHECAWYTADSRSITSAISHSTTYPSPCHGHDPITEDSATFVANTTTMSYDNPYYSRLWMRHNNMYGTLPEEIYWLTSLTSLDFSYNPVVAGTISTQIGQLRDLEHFKAPVYRYKGGTVGSLSSVKSVDWLHGTIPREMALLTKLRVLDVGRTGHRLSGSLPPELFTQLTSLENLLLSGNQFTGSLATEIGLLTKMQAMSIVDNAFTGMLPSELGQLSLMKYTYLSGNQFSGSIPTELGRWTDVIWLNLNNNLLSGSLPSEVGLFPIIKEFQLDNNALESKLPTEVGQLKLLRQLHVSQNQFTGTLRTELGRLTRLETLRMQGNQFSGPLVTTQDNSPLENLTKLVTLDLSSNAFSGTIPKSWAALRLLEEFDIHKNQISGSIPVALLAWGNTIRKVDLSNNDLSGSLPMELFDAWGNVTYLDVSGNEFISGTFPSAYCERTQLLRDNEFPLVFGFDCSDRLCGCNCTSCSLWTNGSSW